MRHFLDFHSIGCVIEVQMRLKNEFFLIFGQFNEVHAKAFCIWSQSCTTQWDEIVPDYAYLWTRCFTRFFRLVIRKLEAYYSKVSGFNGSAKWWSLCSLGRVCIKSCTYHGKTKKNLLTYGNTNLIVMNCCSEKFLDSICINLTEKFVSNDATWSTDFSFFCHLYSQTTKTTEKLLLSSAITLKPGSLE